MGLTSALYAGLSGLDANGMQFEVIGNNIANVNTAGFKARRVLFQSQFSRTLGIGSAASSGYGGSNPMQIGLGAQVAQIDTDFSMGAVEATGINSDLAIEGRGFFVLHGDAGQVYTRNGSFSVNNQGYLIASNGELVQGFGVDSEANIIPGVLTDISIPLGFMTIARGTKNAMVQGNLNAGGDTATQGTILGSMLLQNWSGGAVGDDTLLTDVRDAANPGVPLFSVGDVVTVQATRGGRELPEATFVVNGASRLGDSSLTSADNRFTEFLRQSLGIDTDPSLAVRGAVNVAASRLQILGNSGTQNEIVMDSSAIRINKTEAPFSWTDVWVADGESAYTSFSVYDSLGNPMVLDVTFVLEEANETGTTWRFYTTSSDDTDVDLSLGNGTVQFDAEGQYLTATGTEVVLNRDGFGAETPQSIFLNLEQMTGFAAEGSEIALSHQDGVAIGTLDGFDVGNDGVITGMFTNGLTQQLGQVALATFANPRGLLEAGDSMFFEGPNSGVAVVGPPMTLAAGMIHGGALERSNVDLSKEFVNLITTSTGFSANSRVITTADKMLQEILAMVR